MDLLRAPTCLGFPLLGGSKLGTHISMQLGLLGEVVPFHLLLVEELGFLLATSNEGLKRRPVSKIHEERRKCEGRSSRYLASGNDDITQDAPGLVQDIHHRRDPFVETPPLYALGSIVEREESRRWVLGIHPVEQRLTSRGRAAAPDTRAEGDPPLVLSTTTTTP